MYVCMYVYIASPNLSQHVTVRWLRCRRFAPPLTPVSSMCSPFAPPCSLDALPCSLIAPSCSLAAPPCSPSATSYSLAAVAFLQVLTRTSSQPVLDADQRGASYGSTDHPRCYLLLLPSCSFPLALYLHFWLLASCSNPSVYQTRHRRRCHLISTLHISLSLFLSFSLRYIRLSG